MLFASLKVLFLFVKWILNGIKEKNTLTKSNWMSVPNSESDGNSNNKKVWIKRIKLKNLFANGVFMSV